MSRKRPRSSQPVSAFKSEPRYWLNRLFQNTFTYRGERRTVRKWSVKIQFQGRRQTFSLRSSRRTQAALEACELYQALLTRGWDELRRWSQNLADGQHASHGVSGLSSSPPKVWDAAERDPARSPIGPEALDPGYWMQRLVHRAYTDELHSGARTELSVRIAHLGLSQYFPLGTGDVLRAGRQAVRICRELSSHGWEAVNRKFARELTLALHWSDHPLAWTYTTIHTLLDVAPVVAPAQNNSLRVTVVDEEPGVRCALAWCLNQQPGLHCARTYGTKRLEQFETGSAHLILVRLAESPGAVLLDQMRRLIAGAMVVSYSLYEDSEELFKTTPGGAGSYLLRRTRPTRLLEPAAAAIAAQTFRPDELEKSVWQYFRETFASLPLGGSGPQLAELTQREHEVLGLLSKGSADKEIADRLGISVWTVHGHVRKILEKLGVRNRTGAVARYLQK